jgi:hypothetical protein
VSAVSTIYGTLKTALMSLVSDGTHVSNE